MASGSWSYYYGNQVAYGNGAYFQAIIGIYDDGSQTGPTTNVTYRYSVYFRYSVADSNNNVNWSDPWGSGSANNTNFNYGSGGGERVVGGPYTNAAGIQYGGGNSLGFTFSVQGIAGVSGTSTVSVNYPLPGRSASVPNVPSVGVDTITPTSAHVYGGYAGSENGCTIDVINYRIHRVSDGAWMGDLQGGWGGVTYYNLGPATTYDAYAQAHNCAGWSGFSGNYRFTTPARTPDGQGAPSLSGITPTGLTVTWGAPYNGGSAITGYDVQWATDSGFTQNVGSVAVFSGLQTTLSGLTPGATYWVRTRAVNGMGPGPWSAAATSTTLTGMRVYNGSSFANAPVYAWN